LVKPCPKLTSYQIRCLFAILNLGGVECSRAARGNAFAGPHGHLLGSGLAAIRFWFSMGHQTPGKRLDLDVVKPMSAHSVNLVIFDPEKYNSFIWKIASTISCGVFEG